MLKKTFFLFSFVILTACSQTGVEVTQTQQQAVAMPDTFSADAAYAVLEDGGNAVDAAITAQFVLAVTLPEAGNVGGGGFMTIAFEGSTDFLDYREMAPSDAHRDMYLDDEGDVKPTNHFLARKQQVFQARLQACGLRIKNTAAYRGAALWRLQLNWLKMAF